MKRIFKIGALLLLLALLFACAPQSSLKAKNRMEKREYVSTIDTTSIPSMIYADTGINPESVFYAVKDGEFVYVVYFKNSTDAKMASEYIARWAKSKLKDAETITQGSIIYFGTEKALKDFK